MASTVWYIGKGKRVISSYAWADYNITAPDTVWDASNGWAVLTSSLSFDQLSVLATMRDQFLLDRDGPRVWPAPERITDYQDSAYIYYARIKEFYEELINTETGPQGPPGPAGADGATGPAGAQGPRGTTWFYGTGGPSGTIPGSITGDLYIDVINGDVYTLI